MFKRTDDKITTSQASIILTNSMLGAGILTLPRNVVKAVQTPDLMDFSSAGRYRRIFGHIGYGEA